MKILATSDLHGNLPEIPPCDLLLIGGDICPMYSHELLAQKLWLDTNFRLWLEDVPARHIVAIAGNHDFFIEREPRLFANLDLPWTYLQDSHTIIEGIRIYGLPWIPFLRNWAFYKPDDALELRYDAVPKGTDIVLSHGPPFHVGDFSVMGHQHVGSNAAWDMLERVNPQAYVCGHIHEGFGKYEYDHTTVYNVAYVDEDYNVRGEIVSVKVDGRKKQTDSLISVHNPDPDARSTSESTT